MLLIEAIEWTCSNVLIDAGDSFSRAGGEAFMKAAENNKIEVHRVSFKSKSENMEEVIQNIKQKPCIATVVFGKYADYSALLRAAHNKKYSGQWIMGSNFGNGVNTIRDTLEKSSSGDIDEMLNGLCGFT